jgi:hypothetical protein
MKCTLFSPDVPPSRHRALARWTRVAILGAATLMALPAAHANVTITFDNLPVDLVAHNTYWDTHDGFYVGAFSNSAFAQAGDLVGAVVDGTHADETCWALQCPARSSQYMSILNDGVLDIGRFSPTEGFSVKSFSASFLGPVDSTAPPVAGLVRLQGIKLDGTSMTQTYNLPGAGANGFSFTDFTTTGAFATTQFNEVFIFGFACNAAGSCSAFNSDRGQFAIDDIVTTATAPVPEPSTWLMLGAGLLGLAAWNRRRSA